MFSLKRSPSGKPRKHRLSPYLSNLLARWLHSLSTFRVTLMDGPIYALEYRRMQIHEQQAEKQRKNPLQKTLVFAERAKALMLSVSRLSNAFLTKVVI